LVYFFIIVLFILFFLNNFQFLLVIALYLYINNFQFYFYIYSNYIFIKLFAFYILFKKHKIQKKLKN